MKLKKLLSLIIAIILMFSVSTIGAAAYCNDSLTVKVNGKVVQFPDDKPFVESGRTLVPVRFVAEALGYDVDWKNETRTAGIDSGRIQLTIDSTTAIIDRKAVILDVPARIYGGRTFVPLRFLSENLNCSVDWFGQNHNIIINAKNADGCEVSMYERLLQSSLYYECTPFDKAEYDPVLRQYSYLVLKSSMNSLTETEAEKAAWRICRNEIIITDSAGNYSVQRNEGADIYLTTSDYSLSVRHEIRAVLVTCYPTASEAIYDLMMKAIRQELWEYNDPSAIVWAGDSGTFGLRYYDERESNIKFAANSSLLTIYINEAGYINPVKPTKMSESDIEYHTSQGNAANPGSAYKWFMNYYDLETR